MTRAIVEDFAGPGGWDEGAALLGVASIVGYEHDKAACETAQAAGHHRILADVQTVERDGDCWGYISSPPCQAWSRAGKRQGILDQPAIFAHLDAIIATGEWIDYPRDGWHDPRSPLVLEVVRSVLALRPTWIALEQVPDVLPFWQRAAVLLRGLGYRVWCGVLDSEMYGVAQTRDRAILTASLDPALSVSRPPATHRRYRDGGEAEDLFGELLPCVPMASALAWGSDRAYRLHRGAGMTERNGERPDTPTTRPAPVITSKARTAEWVVRTGNNSMVTGRTGSRAGDGDVQPYERSVDDPAPTLDTGAGSKWSIVNGAQAHATVRGVDDPAPTIVSSMDNGDTKWTSERPATTVQGDPRLAAPGHKDRAGGQRQFDENSVRVTVTEAAILQSFRPDYPWQGSRTKQFEQVGNAIPPLLATAILGHLLGLDWQPICRAWHAAEAVA